MQRAAQLHRDEQRKLRRAGDRARKVRADDVGGHVKTRRRSASRSLDEWIVRLLEEEDTAHSPVEVSRPAGEEGQAVHVAAGRCRVRLDDDEASLEEDGVLVDAELTPELAATQRSDLAVGDRVVLTGREAGRPVVEAALPRRTYLSRPDPHDPRVERVVAANVDVVVVVAALASPPLRPRLIDRYLVAIHRGGAEPVVAVNKVDLVPEDDRHRRLSVLQPLRSGGVPIFECSALEGTGLDALREHLRGRLTAFVGHSGVGKSSLLNALHPDLGLDTGAVDDESGQGRHTTTASTLHELPGGLRIMDTPGIRQFGLFVESADQVEAAFPDIETLAGSCRFTDCTHSHEPRCAVKEAVEEGRLPPQRHASYLRLLGGRATP